MTSSRDDRKRKGLELTLSDRARENLAEVADALGITRSAVADIVFEALGFQGTALVVRDAVTSRWVRVRAVSLSSGREGATAELVAELAKTKKSEKKASRGE